MARATGSLRIWSPSGVGLSGVRERRGTANCAAIADGAARRNLTATRVDSATGRCGATLGDAGTGTAGCSALGRHPAVADSAASADGPALGKCPAVADSAALGKCPAAADGAASAASAALAATAGHSSRTTGHCASIKAVQVAVEGRLTAHGLLRRELVVRPHPGRLETGFAHRPRVFEVGGVGVSVQLRR